MRAQRCTIGSNDRRCNQCSQMCLTGIKQKENNAFHRQHFNNAIQQFGMNKHIAAIQMLIVIVSDCLLWHQQQ